MTAKAAPMHAVRWGIALLATLVIGIAIQQIVNSSRQRKTEMAVAAMSTARGILVPRAIEDLDEFPRETVLTELREQFETAAGQLPLAYALAHFGDVRVDFLVSLVGNASPDEIDIFITALGKSSTEAVGALATAARTADSKENWRHKARLAMFALQLKAPMLAQEMCRIRPDPIQRTLFIPRQW